MMSKLFIPTSTKASNYLKLAGVTIVELLIALAIAVIILGATLALVLSNRRLYETDHARVQAVQNLRGNLDIIGVDIRRAGVNLPANFPALLVDNGTNADTLTVRLGLDRNLILTICVNNTLIVADQADPNCTLIDVNPADGFPDILKQWQDIRINEGGTLKAYIHSPATNQGEFFDVSNEVNLGGGQFELDGTTSIPYPQGSRVYILEERRYQLVANVLEMTVNESDTFQVSFDIVDFQVQVGLQDGSTDSSFNGSSSWKTLDWIEVTLQTQNPVGKGTIRTLSSRFLPRNVISNN